MAGEKIANDDLPFLVRVEEAGDRELGVSVVCKSCGATYELAGCAAFCPRCDPDWLRIAKQVAEEEGL